MATAAAISKVALVTASSAGLGAATVQALAARGFSVVVNYNSNADKANAIVDTIIKSSSSSTSKAATDSQPPLCTAIRADCSQSSEIRRLVSETVATMGRLDVVVSNQGWTRMVDFNNLDENMDEADWDGCFNMNVKSHLWLFYAARPHLKETKGCFVSVASLAGVIPSGSSIPYAVTKAAQIHLIKSLAKVSGPEVRVNSVAPGILLTEWGKKFKPEKLDASINRSALKKLPEVDDVVRQILCFVDSQSMTGHNAVIDAGWSLY